MGSHVKALSQFAGTGQAVIGISKEQAVKAIEAGEIRQRHGIKH